MPYLQVLEEPIENFRFRYKSENKASHVLLIGKNSHKLQETYPTVQLIGYEGIAIIQCWLYQTLQPSIHSHNLVVQLENDLRDVPHEVEVSYLNRHIAEFKGLSIIHTAKKDMIYELKRKNILHDEILNNRYLNELEKSRIDENVKQEAKKLDTNQCCLCFKAFAEDQYKNKILLCDPVYSQPINNKKSARTNELKICRMSSAVSSVCGNDELMLLVEKVPKGNIEVKFFETDGNDIETWSENGKFEESDVHHQYAITLRTPPYHNLNIINTVTVFIQLYRPSDNSTSDPVQFQYKPRRNLHPHKRPRVEYQPVAQTVTSDLSMEIQQYLDNCLPEYSSSLCMTPGGIQTDGYNNVIREIPKCINENFSDSFQIQYIYKRIISDDKLNDDPQIIKKKITETIKNSSINGESILHWSIRCNQTTNNAFILFKIIEQHKLFELIQLRNSMNETCLHIACSEEKVELIRPLLNLGADPNLDDHQGNSALHIAVESNNLSSVLKLLDKTNYNLKIGKILNIDSINDNGMTSLHISVRNRNMNIMKELINKGASVELLDYKNGCNILHMAVQLRCNDIVEYLLKNTEIDVNQLSRSGYTALDYTSSLTDSFEIKEFLLKHKGIYSKFNEIYYKDSLQDSSDDGNNSDCSDDNNLVTKLIKKSEKLTDKEKIQPKNSKGKDENQIVFTQFSIKKYIESNGCWIVPVMLFIAFLSILLVDRTDDNNLM